MGVEVTADPGGSRRNPVWIKLSVVKMIGSLGAMLGSCWACLAGSWKRMAGDGVAWFSNGGDDGNTRSHVLVTLFDGDSLEIPWNVASDVD